MMQQDNDACSSREDNVDPGNRTLLTALEEENSYDHETRREMGSSDVAVIGMSGRFAGSASLEAFWSHLQAGESCIEPVRRNGWETGTHSDSESAYTSLMRWGGMLEHIDRFDPLFFNISPLEAAKMDPQQRLFLEEAYKSFEDAGYSAERLSEKKVGVFVGARSSDYQEQALFCRNHASRLSKMDAHLFLGNDMAMLAARISYFLNCKGPSLTIDTASSSSLVAIHLACESLHTGESEMALAGGVFVMSSPAYAVMAAKTQLLSPDGKCKTFDKSANGIVLGEGVGVLVLKPLETALEDGDHIYGVILGSAMNQDGKTSGMTAPSLLAQKALLVSLYKKAAIHPETVSYIEAHGTGSKLGDPIEVQALTEAFHLFTDKKQFCAIGSHKPNVGHTVTAAGVAGVFKVLLAMKYQQIPPTINIEEANPQIDFQNSPFFLNTELREWKSRDYSPRRAGVSSFGLSGTNCHLILEEPPLNKKTAHEQARPAFFFPLSARTKVVLAQKVEDLAKWLEKEGETYSAEDISYTLVQGRSHFALRSAVVARDTHDLLQALRDLHRLGGSEYDVEKGHASQAESLLHAYGHWLLQDLLETTLLDQQGYKEKLAALADLYVKGYNLDWSSLFKKGRYHRVPLPTYQFSGESYWIDERLVGTGRAPVPTGEAVCSPCLNDMGQASSLRHLREELTHRVSDLLRVRAEEIDAENPLSEYGFDSITFTEFANRLNQAYQLDLTPALFYEHLTIERLTQYLHTTYASLLAPHFVGASPLAPESAAGMTTDEVPPGSSNHRPRGSAVPLTPTAASAIAIIGISGSFPQAPDVQSLWSNLLAGRDCIGEISASRWNWQTCFGNPATEVNKTNVKWAGIVGDVEMFDPLFFGISPAEAEQMDPQQRLLMMYVWKAIEDAGYDASSLSGTNTALFVGTTSSGYSERVSRAHRAIEGYSSTGQTPSVGPGRMSYFLNLHGPSEAIETACSSSLVAIHRGVNAIESGECSLVIVGGVNTLVSPELHISYSKAGMLSPDGRCKTFGASASGYVRSEGVGMLVLKKLALAEQDGDHIYGVIRSSAENHGGRASSLTAPNPRAQADLLIAAYRKAGIDPRTVGYIEAHGTGTELGDPIEINGLKTAFSELQTGAVACVPCATDLPYPHSEEEEPIPQAWCGIGSVKSNIGHLELAAGVVGVIKVLLQMQRKTLVKSLHCEQINPYIQLEGSPFYIVRETQDWEALCDHAGNPLPRRAGVSSFGFGGTNAHVVLEEYVPKSEEKLWESMAQRSGREQVSPLLIVLSARNEERLREQVRQLLVWVQADREAEEPLGQVQRLQDLAYTLQVGREPMEERLALQVSGLSDLQEKLGRYLQQSQEAGDWYRGQVKQYKETVTLLSAEQELQAAIGKWFQDGEYEKLLLWWTRGLRVEWQHLYGKQRPHRISLPTYPFARERYWIPIGTSPMATTEVAPTGSLRTTTVSLWGKLTGHTTLHPLVQYNTSTLWEQQFSSTFHGEEFFLAHHVVKGQRTMPAAAYLEMARAAVALACGLASQVQTAGADAGYGLTYLSLSSVVWVRPLVVGELPVTIHITLEPQDNATLSFLISHERGQAETGRDKPQPFEVFPPEEEAAAQIYCQGRAILCAESPSPNVDLTTVQARCQYQISATDWYQRSRSMGISYGPAHQGIEQLSIGADEILARFRLPAVAAQTHTEGDCRDGACLRPLPYVLHPSIVDAALQACIGLLIEQQEQQTLHLPFSLDELKILGTVPAQGWAWVRRRSGSVTGLVFDIEVCDDVGCVALSLRGLSTRQFPAHKDQTQTVLLTPSWKEDVITGREQALFPYRPQEAPRPVQQVVLLYDLPNIEASHFQTQMTSGERCRSLLDSHSRREQRFQDAVMQLIQELQHLLQSRPVGLVLVQVVVAHREEPSLLEALVGVLKTAEQEYPKLAGQLIEVDGEPEEGELLAWLRENQLRIPQDSHVLYRDGKRWVRKWQEHPEETTPTRIPWKEGGCYLITGGAGGLARLFVQEMARQVQEATVILVGRSALSAEHRAQLEAVACAPCATGGQGSSGGIRLDYQRVDVSDGPAVHALIQRVLQKSGRLDGIIHAAGVLRDSLLLNKTQRQVQEVLTPKVIGVEQLDEASKQIPLDFFILCSSFSAVMGNVGQADYAGANAYLDAFAYARRALVEAGQRQGATVSINWSYWKAGGMQIEAETAQMMRERLGIEPMGTETGIKTLYQALASGFAQVMVLHGQVERIKQQLLPRPEFLVETVPVLGPPKEEQQAVALMGQESPWQAQELQEKAKAYFKKQLATVIHLPVQQVESSAPLEDYGIDSLMAIRFTNVLESSFGPLSKTLLFEYLTIDSVTEYFLHNYPDQLRKVLGIEEAGGASRTATTMPQVTLRDNGTRSLFTRPIAPSNLGNHPHHRLALLRKGTVGTGLAPVRFPTDTPLADGRVQQDKGVMVGDIAIIGMAGRYPGARDLHLFWENLREGRDSITEIPPERWDHRLSFDSDKNKPTTTYCKWGGFLDGVDEFDSLFFNISPHEAERMDPQERLFLECAFATLEDAGYTRDSWDKPRSDGKSQGNGLVGNVGVFVGVMYEEYQLFGAEAQMQGRPVALGGISSSIANRVSYFCNFHGPSLAVDTMCSSSLTAIHLACQSIRQGDCELAIAGGVNVSLHPNKYLFLGQSQFVSSEGHCQSFGVGADGYVPAEGVGAVLLKPLARAEEDRDHIYGVIKATAINHGGKTNGYTVPNPHAQAGVIEQALKEAGIDPKTISYVEAHGTGTVLGDPIEIAGLTRAFEAYGAEPSEEPRAQAPKQYCALGSVKSNIGHAESAAGIAGMTKVLLQMRYRQLVPSLHTEVLNPHIDFSTTPFVVQRELSEWKRPLREGKEVPRRAGISSFGAGGSNAHMILEEYREKRQREAVNRSLSYPVLIVLSARTREQLHQRVQQMLAWIQEEECAEESVGLHNLAYTLQMGREAMEERLALQISSLAELEEKLRKYLQDPQETGDWYRGRVGQHKEMVALFSTDEELQETIGKWFQRGKYEKLLSWWTRGLKISWHLLYTVGARTGASPVPTAPVRLRRISLPTYPFARERYWISTFAVGTSGRRGQGQAAAPTFLPTTGPTTLHPLVQCNISDFFEQRFSSTFQGDEFFLADHQVLGQRVMPGVVYLEMARAAIDLAMRSTAQENGRILRLSQIVWTRPLVISQQPVEVHIALELREKQKVVFTISSRTHGTEDEALDIVSKGRAELYIGEEIAQSLDLTAIQTRCQRFSLSATECYQRYRSLGISYGPAMQGIEQLSVGEGEVLARLREPLVVAQTLRGKPTGNNFVLHPSMLDAALQACIGLLIEQQELQNPYLPFALEELSILDDETPQGQPVVSARGWAWVRQRVGIGRGSDPVPMSVFDIDVCDDAGRIVVRLRGLSTRMLSADVLPHTKTLAPLVGSLERSSKDGIIASPSPYNSRTLLYAPLWDLVILPQQTGTSPVPTVPGDLANQVVIVGGIPDEQSTIAHLYPHASTLELPTNASIEQMVQRLQEFGDIGQLFWLAPHDQQIAPTHESILAIQQQRVLQCFRLIKALLQLGYASKALGFTVITRQTCTLSATETGNPASASLLGLFGSLAKEASCWKIQLVDLPGDASLPLAEMLRLSADPQGRGWLYRNGHWYRLILVPLEVSTFETHEVYRRGGVYVVIGGAGGIGEVWSEALIRRYQARIIWIGRSDKTATIAAKLQRLASIGPAPDYICADATDRQALEDAYLQIKQRHGQIHGVIHAAIVLKDQSLANMDEERFQAALAAKVEVSVRLAQVFEQEPLDFVLFFSSLNAFTRNAGQSNYAAGSTFEDVFAAWLRRHWSCAVKVMNWGYWGNVGVVASQEYRERMARVGLGSIEPAEAMEALEHLLAGPVDQMALLKTTQPVAPGFALWGEMIRSEEIMTVYPEHIPSCIHSLWATARDCPYENMSPNHNAQRESTEAETRQGMQEMEQLLCELLWGQLQSLGLFRERHAVLSNLREQAGISASYDLWLQESLRLLEQKLYLHCHDGTCTIEDSTLIEQTPLWQRWDEHKVCWMQNADLCAQVVLVETMLHALPAILTGKRPATEIMFPNGSMELVERIYQHNVIADSFNEILAQLLATYLQERLVRDKHARVRILEIGAGTGGTTSRVLQTLQPYQTSIAEYCYSDISEAFLRYGQRKYGADYPALSYQLFNVEKPLAEQGIALGSYDVVIATNVLHATSNIRHTMRNAKAALKKHGLLFLNEITGASLFSHLTFGLLSGWWAYEDPELRVQGCPALTAENWQVVLSSEGFGEFYVPTQDVATGELVPQEVGQQVIIAESDGVVRQPRSLPPRAVPLQPVMINQDKPAAPADNMHEVSQEKSVTSSLGIAPANSAFMVSHQSMGYAQEKANLDDATTFDTVLHARSVTYLKEQVGKVLNLPITKIDAAEPLINYGLDSILVLQLTEALRVGMEQISSTIFFEYATIDALVEHFLYTHKEELQHLVGLGVPAKQENMQALDHPRLAQPNARVFLQRTTGTLRCFLTEDNTVGTGTSVAPSTGRDIAIIGLAGRYPGAKDVQTFWHLLKAGKSGIREIPQERWDWRPYFQTEKGAVGSIYTKWGGFLEDIECFDAPFFHISPREAELMDPQERLFLEVSYTCIEDAGYTPGGLREQGPVGVFVGVMNGNYSSGARYWSIANRVSFALGFQGPSVAVDTACSSSLTALHFAVESLMSGTSASALVGGVNLIVDPVHYVRLSQLGMLSAGDQCRSFGENANGFVDGEGVGAILLKPLDRAEADGDHIYGVIKSTAINHGGKTNGYTVPNPQAQTEVIGQALKEAGIDPRTISYVEAHGTGTVLGDPIEIAGLTRAFTVGIVPCAGPGPHSDPVSCADPGSRSDPVPCAGAVPDSGDTGWCAIGSVKSNIGHTESAAGIAGITKVLLQMRYGQLVPSLHAEVLNPHIDFSATPFVVQRKLSEWKRPQENRKDSVPVNRRDSVPDNCRDSAPNNRRDRACPCPRRAGISSFGAGGSNAHVILEEYIERQQAGKELKIIGAGSEQSTGSSPRPVQQSRPALIVLSARTQEQLYQQVQQLQSWIQEKSFTGTEEDLDNLSYTLQVGREPMEERLALQVVSLQELEEKLGKYIKEWRKGGDWYRGRVKRCDPIAAFAADEDGQQAVAAWISKGKYEKLLQFWVNGLTVDWKLLYTVGVAQPRRISLPTYPFARERYWLSQCKPSAPSIGRSLGDYSDGLNGMVPYLHPLLHRNTSDLTSQRYCSTFSGREFFLHDHQIEQRPVLPAVVALELARAAVQHASGEQDAPLTLTQVVWIRPVAVAEEPLSLEIRLEPQQDGSLHYQLVGTGLAPIRTGDRKGASSSSTLRHGDALEESKSRGVDDGFTPSPERGQPNPPLRSLGLLYSQGQAYLSQKRERPQLDVEELRQQCQRARWSGQDCYERYEQMGLHYGAGMRALQGLERGEGQVIAQLELPKSVQGTQEQYMLHPSLLDGALQAALGLLVGGETGEEEVIPQLPYALSQLEVYAGTETQMWAWVRKSVEGGTEQGMQRLDIDLCDRQGQVCAQLRGLVIRPGVQTELARLRRGGPQLFKPSWQELVEGDLVEQERPEEQIIWLLGADEAEARRLSKLVGGVSCRALEIPKVGEVGVAERYEAGFMQVLRYLQQVLRGRLRQELLVQLVVPMEEPGWMGLVAVLKTAQLEQPKFRGQLLEVQEVSALEQVAQQVKLLWQYPHVSQVRVREGRLWWLGWQEVRSEEVEQPWRPGGVYLLTGGAGGLGRLLAREIGRQAPGATLILGGRRSVSPQEEEELQRQVGEGVRVCYWQMDVGEKEEVREHLKQIEQEYGRLNGIMHSAGELRDSYLLAKSEEEVREVLRPKVAGVVALDEGSREMELDCFVLYSSLAGCVGNVGQGDYAAANAFMDAYAQMRNRLVREGKRYGKTIALNWPLWQDGGMKVDTTTEKMRFQTLGMRALSEAHGIKALYQAMASGADQVLVVDGDQAIIEQKLLPMLNVVPVPTLANDKESNKVLQARNSLGQIQASTYEQIKQIVARLLCVEPEFIDMHCNLQEYAFDQVTLIELTNILNQQFQAEVTSTFILEHETLHHLAQALIALHVNIHEYFSAPGAVIICQKEIKQNQQVKDQEKTVARNLVPDVLKEHVTAYFKKLLSSAINLSAHRIEEDAQLEQYGVNSVMIMEMTNSLEKVFGTLPKTLFFEYQSIYALTGYFMEVYPEKLALLLLQYPTTDRGNEENRTSHLTSSDVDNSNRMTPNTPSSHRACPDGFVPGIDEQAGPPLEQIQEVPDRTKGVPVSRFDTNRSLRLVPGTPIKSTYDRTGDIAVIGLAGRYPGANSIQEFWENLRAGKDCVSEIPAQRWEHSRYYNQDKHASGSSYSKWGGFLEGVELFDPLFFNISPREAEIMNPQERLFLETVWNLFESIGYTRERVRLIYEGKVGVYVGAMYQLYHAIDTDMVREAIVSLSSYNSIANRVSYFFDLQGASIAIDTACSSSTIAIHMACESLKKGECRLAIAGGVNLSLHPKKYIGLSETQMIGSRAESRSFSDGDGYVPAEAVGAVLLKPLVDAERDGDTILAVIKGTATNHSGHTHGFSVPNLNVQARLIADNFAHSGIDPRTVSYVEAAANGSALGDPIELQALTKAFHTSTTDLQFCAIGSVKSNIGHAEAASGMSQLTKVILQLQHQELVPSIMLGPLNPNIRFEDSPFYLQRKLQKWEQPVMQIAGVERNVPRRATVSTFGAGGSNAHIIVEEYIAPPKGVTHSPKPSPQVMVFSARTADRLYATVAQILAYVEAQPEILLADMAYTLQIGREAMAYRLALVVDSRELLIQGLRSFLQKEPEASIASFTGNLEDDHTTLRSLFTGKVGEAIIQVLLAEKNLEKLALHWSQGGHVPWELLHQGEHMRMLSLPTYPFARQRYWITEPHADASLIESPQVADACSQQLEVVAHSTYQTHSPTQASSAVQQNIQDFITKMLAQELGLSLEQIKVNKHLLEYGVDSLTVRKLQRSLEKHFQVNVTGKEVFEHPTVQSLSVYVAATLGTRRSVGARACPRPGSPWTPLSLGDHPLHPPGQGQAAAPTAFVGVEDEDPVNDALEKFRVGALSLEEIENFIDGNGGII